MKRILITGANSYIGTSVERWLLKEPDKYVVDTVDMRNDEWRKINFSEYDVVFHVAAIVHKKETLKIKGLYLKVNRDLPIEVAKRAKKAGVKQFVFMSTMAIYGQNGNIAKEVIITKDDKPNPNTYYGESKIQAENLLSYLSNEQFKIVLLRPPMVYGAKCPGNYARLEKLANRVPVFPMIENKRSMLHIDNLCKYVKKYIDVEAEGIFFPQDDEYVNTSLLVKKIVQGNGKKIYFSRTLGWIIKLIGRKIPLINKVFGNLVYEKNIVDLNNSLEG